MSLRDRTPTGAFNKLVELQQLRDRPERGATGERLKRYAPYATVWAALTSTFAGAGSPGPLPGTATGSVVCLPYSLSLWQLIKPEHRVYWKEGTKERTLEIKSITNYEEANVEIRLQCVEVLA